MGPGRATATLVGEDLVRVEVRDGGNDNRLAALILIRVGRQDRMGRRTSRRATTQARGGNNGRTAIDRVRHLSAAGLFQFHRHHRPGPGDRGPRLRLAVALRPSLQSGPARPAVVRRVDTGHVHFGADHEIAGRPPGAVQQLPSPGAAREDGDVARRPLGRPRRARHRQRLGRPGAPGDRSSLGLVPRALGAAG